MTHTSRWTRRSATLALGLAATLGAFAQTPPPLRILVGFPPGGGVDNIARILADTMGQALGQTVVVENRPGAGGMLAAQALKAASPDGNTLMLTNDHTVAILSHTLKNPGFSTTRDFAPVALVSDKSQIALATHIGTKITQIKDISEWARQNPGKANFGVPAPASVPEFAVGLLAKALQIDAVSAPYRGGAPLIADLAAGQIPFGVTAAPELVSYAKSQKMRVLAVSGATRDPELPDVPTFTELGIKGLEQPNIVGIYAPAGTPTATISRLSEAARTALQNDKVKERLQTLGAAASYGNPEKLAQTVQRISDTWGPVIRQSGYQPQ